MRTFLGAFALLSATSSYAQPAPSGGNAAHASNVAVAPAARPAAAVVDAFHAALGRGDTKAAQSHLAANALIYELGGVERGRQEYAAHHLGADAGFARPCHRP